MKKVLFLITCALTISMHAMKLDNQVIPLDKKTQSDTISTYEDFQNFFETKPNIGKIIKFDFSQLTPTQRVKIFQDAERQCQAVEELTNMVVLSGREVKQFKVTPEIILYLEMLKKITDSLAPKSSTE
jgi:hypothetical protein